MPLIRIDLPQGRSAEFRRTAAEVDYTRLGQVSAPHSALMLTAFWVRRWVSISHSPVTCGSPFRLASWEDHVVGAAVGGDPIVGAVRRVADHHGRGLAWRLEQGVAGEAQVPAGGNQSQGAAQVPPVA